MAGSDIKLLSAQGIKEILKQGGVEATEEIIAEITEGLTDYAINGDRSQIGMRIKQLIDSGVSPGDAPRQAFAEALVVNPALAGMSGFINGFTFGGAAVGIGNLKSYISNGPSVKDGTSAVAQTGKQMAMPGKQTTVNRIMPVSPQTVTTQTAQQSVLQTEIDPNATVTQKVQESIVNTAQEMKSLAEETQTNIYNDSVRNAYNQFRINPINANAEAFYNTSIQNIDNAIAAEQQIGADTTALVELKGKMESAKSEAAQAKPDTEAQAAQAAAERSMTKAVSMLTNLPADVQAKADAGAARQALYDYMKADESGKAAAHDKVVRVLKGSISSALETKELDTGTRQTLERMLDNIDSKGER